MRRGAGPVALLAGALLLAGCGSDDGDAAPALSAGGAYMPQPVSGTMAAGFLVITNTGGAKDELTSVTSDAAGSVTVHETVGGAMRQTDSLDVPAHGRLVLERGGNHLMFEKLRRKPVEGDRVRVTLHFAESGDLQVELPVKPATYTPRTGG